MKTPAILLVIAFGIVLSASAQDTKFVDFDNEVFHTQFNNPPQTSQPTTDPDNSSSTYSIYSQASDIAEGVTVRTLYRDIPVNKESADFYTTAQSGEKVIDNKPPDDYRNNVNGHPYSYAQILQSDGCTRRELVVIVNSRKVVMVTLISLKKDIPNIIQYFAWEIIMGQFKLEDLGLSTAGIFRYFSIE